MILMRGHNMSFYEEIQKIIPKSSLLPFLFGEVQLLAKLQTVHTLIRQM